MGLRLTQKERARLEHTTRQQRAEARDWRRARMILQAADGESVSSIARQLGTSRSRVSEWLTRFRAERLEGLLDTARSGRPRVITALERHQVVAAACQSPEAFGLTRTIWTREALADAVVGAGLVASSTGLRRKELEGIRWCDVDLDRMEIVVPASLAKSRRQQRVLLGNQFVRAFMAATKWLATRPHVWRTDSSKARKDPGVASLRKPTARTSRRERAQARTPEEPGGVGEHSLRNEDLGIDLVVPRHSRMHPSRESRYPRHRLGTGNSFVERGYVRRGPPSRARSSGHFPGLRPVEGGRLDRSGRGPYRQPCSRALLSTREIIE